MAFYPLLKKYTEEIIPHLPPSCHVTKKSSIAFLVFSIVTLLDIELEEAILAVTDGPDDCGIDGIYLKIVQNKVQVHFFSTKFTLPKNTFNGTDIKESLATVNKIIEARPLSSQNKALKEKVLEIQDIIHSEEEKIPEYFLHLVSSSEEKSNIKKYVDPITEKNININLYGGWDILSLLDKKDKGAEITRSVSIVTEGEVLNVNESGVSG